MAVVDPLVLVLTAILGTLAGAGLTAAVMRARRAALDERLRGAEERGRALRDELGEARRAGEEAREALRAEAERRAVAEERVAQERRASEREVEALKEARAELGHTFEALSGEALRRSQHSFLELARETMERFHSEARGDLDQRRQAVEQLVAPLREALAKVDSQMATMEQDRRQAYGGIAEQVRSLLDAQQRLQAETGRLAQALRAPDVRGRWGEIQLRRVVEIAGMLPHCDFVEQTVVGGEEGRLRPDLVIRLPGETTVVIDAKAPLKAYLEALEVAEASDGRRRFADHARQLREHMGRLSAKSYWEQFDATPEFVVMFLPGESFFSAALEADPSLIEIGVEQRVLLATPTTLIALLRAVAYGWRQQTLAESARTMSLLGRELYERLAVFGEHMERLGRGLQGAVAGFNAAVGSLEGRVLPAARRFGELGISSPRDIPELAAVDQAPRELTAPEWEEKDEG